MNDIQEQTNRFLDDIRSIIDAAGNQAVRSVDFFGCRCIGTWANVSSKKSNKRKTVSTMVTI